MSGQPTYLQLQTDTLDLLESDRHPEPLDPTGRHCSDCEMFWRLYDWDIHDRLDSSHLVAGARPFSSGMGFGHGRGSGNTTEALLQAQSNFVRSLRLRGELGR